MTTRFARPLVRMAVIVGLAAALGACQTMADLDPTGLLGDDTPAAATDNSSTPDLANVPDAPPTATPDDQKEVASSLAADSAKTQYSADALRAGTEAAAPSPGAAPPVSQQALAATDAPPSADAPSAVAPAPTVQASAQPPSAPPPSAEAPTAEAPAAPIAVAPGAARSAAATASPSANPMMGAPMAPASPPVQTAAIAPPAAAMSSAAPMAPPPGAEPAVPAVPPAGSIHGNMMATPAMSDSALGFAPSAAPPLDPSVRNFVSAPILSHYRQTASLAQTAGVGAGTAAAVPTRSGMTSAASAVAAMNGGVTPSAIVYFAGDGTSLTAAGRSQVRSAVAAFKANGSAGTVRVVGHASSRTANMPVEKHLEVIFDKSQKRANAVAQELIHEGIPADKVMIEAVGDSQPVYYESMPKGEDGNRRTDIFVQG